MMRKLALMGSVALCGVALSGLSLTTPASAQFRAALSESQAAIDEGARSQRQVESLDDQTSELLQDFRAAQGQLTILERFNATRAREVENQLRQIRDIEQDIENIEGLQRAIVPLLEEMISALDSFVQADIPFYPDERQRRIQRLQAVMADSTQTAATRYNLIMEAFQIENEYGRTMDSYEDIVVTEDGTELAVQFLRIGRLALVYKSADDTILRIYNREAGAFEDLDMQYLDEVRRGIRMANEQTPPDLLEIPVTAPVQGGSAQ